MKWSFAHHYRYSYSKTRGLFGGVSVEGSVIVERQDANSQAYNSPVTARLLLGGTVDRPQWAMPLIKTLEACTGLPGNREWINDDADRTPGGTYAFGGLSSPDSISRSSSRSPSFLRKKKKPEPPNFPPASWGTENNSGSYFSDPAPQTHSRNMTWDGGNRINSDPFDSPGPVNQSYQYTNMPTATAASADSSHRRASSLSYRSATESGNPFLSSIAAQRNAPIPHIKPRIELVTPLLSHEGVARAIAIYDFNAAEVRVICFYLQSLWL